MRVEYREEDCFIMQASDCQMYLAGQVTCVLMNMASVNGAPAGQRCHGRGYLWMNLLLGPRKFVLQCVDMLASAVQMGQTIPVRAFVNMPSIR